MINSIFHFCHKYIHNITTVTIDASIPSKGGRNEFIKKYISLFLIIICSSDGSWKLKKKKNKTWFNRQMLIGLLFRFMWQVWQNFTRFIFVNGVFWARTARVTWSWSRIWSSYYISKLCYGFDCTLCNSDYFILLGIAPRGAASRHIERGLAIA